MYIIIITHILDIIAHLSMYTIIIIIMIVIKLMYMDPVVFIIITRQAKQSCDRRLFLFRMPR